MFEYPQSGMFNLRVSCHTNLYQPLVDVIETNDEFLVRVEIAGVDKNDFNIKFEQDTLTISGVRNDPYKSLSFHQMEIHFGEFQVEMVLYHPVESNSINADYRNGILEVRLAKAIPHEIHIKDKDA